MELRIRITAGTITATARLNDSECAKEIYQTLPLEARASTWGDEVYFSIPVDCAPENPRSTVELGDLGYWPEGNCFCIFFGPTPMSRGTEIRPASPVEVFGRIDGDSRVFKQVTSGTMVSVEAIEQG